jgi:hypothetical protein
MAEGRAPAKQAFVSDGVSFVQRRLNQDREEDFVVVAIPTAGDTSSLCSCRPDVEAGSTAFLLEDQHVYIPLVDGVVIKGFEELQSGRCDRIELFKHPGADDQTCLRGGRVQVVFALEVLGEENVLRVVLSLGKTLPAECRQRLGGVGRAHASIAMVEKLFRSGGGVSRTLPNCAL